MEALTVQIGPEADDPLPWNATLILYASYARLAIETTFLEEGFCHSNGPSAFRGLKLMYSHFDLSKVDVRSIRNALTGFTGVIHRGIKFLSQTAPWSRSLEHAIGGFYSAVFLVTWIRCVEDKPGQMTFKEVEILDQLRIALEEGDVHIYPESLAATVVRACMQLMERVWIWGITPLMGEVFRLYAEDILGSRAATMDVDPVVLEDEQRSEYGD